MLRNAVRKDFGAKRLMNENSSSESVDYVPTSRGGGTRNLGRAFTVDQSQSRVGEKGREAGAGTWMPGKPCPRTVPAETLNRATAIRCGTKLALQDGAEFFFFGALLFFFFRLAAVVTVPRAAADSG
jgi:hypothetical protein